MNQHRARNLNSVEHMLMHPSGAAFCMPPGEWVDIPPDTAEALRRRPDYEVRDPAGDDLHQSAVTVLPEHPVDSPEDQSTWVYDDGGNFVARSVPKQLRPPPTEEQTKAPPPVFPPAASAPASSTPEEV